MALPIEIGKLIHDSGPRMDVEGMWMRMRNWVGEN